MYADRAVREHFVDLPRVESLWRENIEEVYLPGDLQGARLDFEGCEEFAVAERAHPEDLSSESKHMSHVTNNLKKKPLKIFLKD